jgi:hypothetical protein
VILAQLDRAAPHHQHEQEQEQEMATMEDEADDGLDFLERELLGEDEQMGDGDGDGDDEEMEEVMDHQASRAAVGPVSMNQFAGGGFAVEDEDDDYTSSEESDED